MTIPFTKMNGAGNDFVIVDNRDGQVPDAAKKDIVEKLCHRDTGVRANGNTAGARKIDVGADGMIFIEKSDKADFRWDFYNDDGGSAEMCGNGARCAARFALENGIVQSNEMKFETTAGLISAQMDGTIVTTQLTSPKDLRRDMEIELNGERVKLDSLDTGVPHAVVFTENIKDVDIQSIGRGIRNHDAFAPRGTNVNLVQVVGENQIEVRTYERGVEDETLACGTGVTACAIIAALQGKVKTPVEGGTKSGDVLTVYFQPENGSVDEVKLKGPTEIMFQGSIAEI